MGQLGRITVYSISGCPHCLAAKKRLKDENLEYMEVGVDRFPARVRAWLQQRTGKTSVPQIFFNSKYVGGNKELQEALDQEDSRQELLEIVKEAPDESDQDLPLLPNPGDAIDDGDEEEPLKLDTDPHFHLVEKLVERNLAGDNYPSLAARLRCAPVKHSVTGGNLIKFISDEGEKEPEKVATHLLESRFLRKVNSTEEKASWSEADLYVVTGLEAGASNQCLNTFQLSSSVRIPPDTLAQHIRNILLRLFSSFLSADGSAVDYAGISRSPLFAQFKLLAVELQRAEVDTMTRTDKIAFFINIYNALVIHAHVERGVPTSTYQRYKFFSGMSYNIGGYNLSLNDIENGVLRSNRAAMATLYMKPFSASDPRMKIILPEVEPRIHFALNCGAKSCPPIKTFSGNEVLSQLDVATGAFLENDDALWISAARDEVRLTQLFEWYAADFGGSKEEVIAWILDHVTLAEKRAALEEVVARSSYRVTYTPYDWGHNSKE